MAVDLWAFGCFAYELCAGDSPFGTAKDTHYEVYLRVMGGQYSIPRGWSSECRDLITRMLTEVRDCEEARVSARMRVFVCARKRAEVHTQRLKTTNLPAEHGEAAARHQE